MSRLSPRRSLATTALLDACLRAGFQVNPRLREVVTCDCGLPVAAAEYEHHRRNLCAARKPEVVHA